MIRQAGQDRTPALATTATTTVDKITTTTVQTQVVITIIALGHQGAQLPTTAIPTLGGSLLVQDIHQEIQPQEGIPLPSTLTLLTLTLLTLTQRQFTKTLRNN